jgi:hypothetical protein
MLFLNFTNFYDNKINTKSLLELSVGQKKKKTNKQTNNKIEASGQCRCATTWVHNRFPGGSVFYFVFFVPVSCVPNVASAFSLFATSCPFGLR